jgi:hypothetical protein
MLCRYIDRTNAEAAARQAMVQEQQKAPGVKQDPPTDDPGISGVAVKPKGPVIGPSMGYAEMIKHEFIPDRHAIGRQFEMFDKAERFSPQMKWEMPSNHKISMDE